MKSTFGGKENLTLDVLNVLSILTKVRVCQCVSVANNKGFSLCPSYEYQVFIIDRFKY
jgi:hypothetical protein